jgi:cathepsin D
VPLGGCPFLGYDAPVTIDTQSFQLDIDTGSTTTFVAASSCSNCGVSPEYSPPSSANTGQTTQSAYGSGQVEGNVYKDLVRVGAEMPTVTMEFGGITNQQQFFLREDCNGGNGQQGEGLLGLGPIGLDTIGTSSSDAYFTDLVASSMGMANVFAVNLCSSGGNMWFGGYDTNYASGAPEYTPLVNNGYWSVQISSIGLGSQTFSNSSDRNAVVDTGTGSFLMPSGAFSGLVSALNSNSEANSIFGSGQLSQVLQGNNCVQPMGGQSQAEIDAALPKLTVTVPKTGGGSFTLSMPATQSYLALMAGAYCGGVGDNSQLGGQTIWGAPGLRAYITIFDIGNSQIGFAAQSSCQ